MKKNKKLYKGEKQKLFKGKGQAALEFLTTYGWAFLVILVMIAALTYFGILSPNKFLPERCQFSESLSCDKYVLGVDGATFSLRNAYEDSVIISKVGYKLVGSGDYVDCEPFSFTTINSDSVGKIVCNFKPNFLNVSRERNDKSKVQFRVKYYKLNDGTDYSREVYGEIFAKVNELESDELEQTRGLNIDGIMHKVSNSWHEERFHFCNAGIIGCETVKGDYILCLCLINKTEVI